MLLKNIVVFASGSGTNFQSIIDATENGTLNAHITGLVSNKKEIGALQRAEKHAIPTFIIDDRDYEHEEEYVSALLSILTAAKADCIVLAGYLRKIPVPIIKAFRNRILNIHPSLLPKFGGKGFFGMRVHRAVIESGELESGCTVHVVTEEYDEGPIIEQEKVKVLENETAEELATRVLQKEHDLYPQAIQKHLKTLS